MTIKNRITAVLVAVLVAVSFMPLIAGEAVYAESIPEPHVTWDHDWTGTLRINQNRTIKISGVTHESTEQDGAAIRISDHAVVNLVFEGNNVLSANPNLICAGIEVEEGSTVNIYGLEGSTLKVTGGKYGAGIGGAGYGSVSATNPKAGNINIYSGTITAVGGDKGAGIGSGYHSTASIINIEGGNITALGMGGGAGIGCGYGTSGGAAAAAGVGFYHGGDITISGGTVRAAGWNMNFDDFDQYDPQTMYGTGYADTFAAGIGGGYGASSGHITIEGDADVTALGSCGGAGIGAGRGTSKTNNYDKEKAFCDVTIGGTAKVVAMSTADRRTSIVGDTGGAGIGLGRGFGLEGQNVGTIVIEGNANVYAYADAGANGIGGSTVVGKYTGSGDDVTYPANGHVASLTVGPNCTVVAECGQPLPERSGFDEAVDPASISMTSLEFSDGFIANAGIGSETPFFTEDRLPAEIEVRSANSQELLATLLLDKEGKASADVHIPASYSSVYYKVKDAVVDGRGVLLAHSDADNGWKFEDGQNNVSNLLFEEYKITYNLNGGKNASANPAKYAVYGSSAVKLKAPTRSGYTFEGWYGNSKLTGSKITSIPAGSVGDKEVWAKWKAEESSKKPIAKVTSKGKNGLNVSWTKVKGASGYDVFVGHCNHNYKAEKVKLAGTVKAGKLSYTVKGLSKSSSYKVVVKAFVKKDGKKKYIGTSQVMHAYTSGGTKKCTNAKAVTVNKAKVSLKKGKTFKIKAKVKPLKKGKKLMPSKHVAKLRYLSTNPKVCTVNKKGKITAKGKGTCIVYVYAHNGVSKAIKVTVK